MLVARIIRVTIMITVHACTVAPSYNAPRRSA